MKKLLPSYILIQILATVLFLFPSVRDAFAQGRDAESKPFWVYHAFGDSITFGIGASMTSDRYVSLIAKDKALTLTDLGISGSQACDVADTQILPNENPGITSAAMYTEMVGINDADVKGTGAYEANYINCLTAGLSWLGIPSSHKTFAKNGSISGAWSNDGSWPDGVGLFSTTTGSTLSLTLVTSGRPIYLWYRMQDSNGGSFTYALDGGPVTTVTTASTPTISTQNGGTTGRGVVRLPRAEAGAHTVTISVTSSTSPKNSVSIGAIGTPSAPSDKDLSYVYQAGVTKQRQDGNSAATAQYNSDALSIVNLLADDGLKVFFVPVRNFIDGLPSQMFDQLHPNDLGHSLIRNAFESVWK
jgi:lysophospholipase L1-like esterase